MPCNVELSLLELFPVSFTQKWIQTTDEMGWCQSQMVSSNNWQGGTMMTICVKLVWLPQVVPDWNSSPMCDVWASAVLSAAQGLLAQDGQPCSDCCNYQQVHNIHITCQTSDTSLSHITTTTYPQVQISQMHFSSFLEAAVFLLFLLVAPFPFMLWCCSPALHWAL